MGCIFKAGRAHQANRQPSSSGASGMHRAGGSQICLTYPEAECLGESLTIEMPVSNALDFHRLWCLGTRHCLRFARG